MAKRGPKPKGQVDTSWSEDFAYAVGLIVADGCLSKDGRHIDLTSKDTEQLENFLQCLGLQHIKIGDKANGRGGTVGRVQFGDLLFYRFLEDIGITTAKSNTMGPINVPDKYFFDFLRGVFDGDGCFYSFWDKRWRSSFMFYTTFSSGSLAFIEWLQLTIERLVGVQGHTCGGGSSRAYQLKYAKSDSTYVLAHMYHSDDVTHLSRKKLKIDQALGKVGMTLCTGGGT